jgi:hypothetical protein
VIIADNDPANEYLVDMIDDDSGRVTNIPSLFLRWIDGNMIEKSLLKKNLKYAIINIPLNFTLKTERLEVKKAPWHV